MLVEEAVGEFRGDGGTLTEVYHVEAAGGDDRGDLGAGGGVEALGAGGEDAADEFVGPLRGRDVEHTGDQAAGDERLHRAAAVAGRGEDEDFVAGGFEQALRFGHAGGRVAKHAGDDEGLFGRRRRRGRRGRPCVDHAANRAGGVFKNSAGDAVDAGDVHNRGHHRNVGRANVRRGLAARERRDH